MILLELLYPSRCPVCDRVLPVGEKICKKCEEKLKKVEAPFCRKCGKPMADMRLEYCPDCRQYKHLYLEGRAVYEYASVKHAIYRLKYNGRYEYADYFGCEAAKHLEHFICEKKPDALVPVPLHPVRKRERGYNQAEALARGIGKRLNIPVDTKLIQRTKNTIPQKLLDRQLRQNNLKKAFKIVRNDVKLSTIIIIDDIYTTGSTIDAMAEVLLEAGISKIYYIALSIGRE